MSSQLRPLSPHLQIYRPQISSILSILHRLTGIILASIPVIISIWLGVECQNSTQEHFFYVWSHSLVGYGYFFLVTYAFFYHFLNGIRHLLWDIGWGFSLKSVHISGWIVIILSFCFTILRWI